MRILRLGSFLMALVMVGTAVPTEAGWEFSSLSVSAGQSALSSGLAGSLRLTNGKQLVDLAVQQEQGWLVWGKKSKFHRLEVELGGSIGHAYGEPWIGPYLYTEMPIAKVAGQPISIGTLQWPFLLACEPERWRNDDVRNTEPLPWAMYSDISVNIGQFGVTASRTDFLNEKIITCLGSSYAFKLRKDFSISPSITYNFRTKKLMYLIAGKWSK